MLAWLLNFAYLGLIVAISPWLAFQAVVRGKYRRGWREKLFGMLPRRDQTRECLWFHAVSVGEVLQLQPVIERLARDCPGTEIVISTTTATGYDVAARQFPGRHVVFYPLDFSWAVARALDCIRPSAIVLVELELWPNFLFAAARRQIPVMLINGRLSEHSFRGYRRIRPLARAMLRTISRLAVQNEVYARRLVELGAAGDKVVVTGSIKFDHVRTDRGADQTRELRRAFGLGSHECVFVAGSTHAPEERHAIDAWLAVRAVHRDLRLILVPRHKERFDEVARLVEHEYRLPLVRRSRRKEAAAAVHPGSEAAAPHPVLLLDTLGELSACWGLANIAFVGGSLTRRGGQNMIEPAAFGAAVLFGPNTWNFKDVVDLLVAGDAALVVSGPAQLATQLAELVASPATRQTLGHRAQRLVLAQQGATDRTVALLRTALGEGEAPERTSARAA